MFNSSYTFNKFLNCLTLVSKLNSETLLFHLLGQYLRANGKLEILKCAVYTIKWNFNEQGIPYLDNNFKATIFISSSDTKTQQTLPHLSNHIHFKYLGASSAPNDNQNIQFQESLNNAKKAATILSSTTFYHTQAKLYTNAYVNQNLYCPFPSVSFFFQIIFENQQDIYPKSRILHGIQYNVAHRTPIRLS